MEKTALFGAIKSIASRLAGRVSGAANTLSTDVYKNIRRMKKKGLISGAASNIYKANKDGGPIGWAMTGLAALSLPDELLPLKKGLWDAHEATDLGESLYNLGKTASKGDKVMNLKDFLVKKISEAKGAESAKVSVSKTDVALLSKFAAVAMHSKGIGSHMTKTAAIPEAVGGVLERLMGVGGAALQGGADVSRAVSSSLGRMLGEGPKIMGGIGSDLLPLLHGGALAAGTGLAASTLYSQLSDSVKSRQAYNQMFQEFPELNEVPREQVDKYWGVLNDFAPVLTKNPLVAGQFVSNMLNYGLKGIDHATAGQLIGFQQSARNASGIGDMLSMLSKGYESASRDTMSPDQHQIYQMLNR